jgi:segregation and condensation protein B
MTEARYELKVLEAILFAATEPVSETDLAGRLPHGCDVPALLDELKGHYAGRGINLTRASGKWAFRTAEDLAPHLRFEAKVERKLSRAATETLAIIAYHQPVTRTEIEEIRGVAIAKGTLDVLLEIGWIKPIGRRQTPGRPTTWGTTEAFLLHFGFDSLADLPGLDELKAAGLLDTRPASTIVRPAGIAEDSEPPGPVDADVEPAEPPELTLVEN